jgi:hypothetical protein
MVDAEENRHLLLERLNRLLAVYESLPDPDVQVYDVWTAKDILAHLTFWHESFARNVSALARGAAPTPLRGKLSDLNQAGVDGMRSCSLTEVMERLEYAQRVIQEDILKPGIGMIPYRKGSRDYSPEEHLEVVIDHISKHMRDIVRVCQT